MFGVNTPVAAALLELSDETLAHVIALALYGRGDGADSFESELEDTRVHLLSEGRDLAIAYISAKPLARYLRAGLARIANKT